MIKDFEEMHPLMNQMMRSLMCLVIFLQGNYQLPTEHLKFLVHQNVPSTMRSTHLCLQIAGHLPPEEVMGQ